MDAIQVCVLHCERAGWPLALRSSILLLPLAQTSGSGMRIFLLWARNELSDHNKQLMLDLDL